MAMTLRPFHLAIPVDDIDAARAFYGGVMGFAEGRSDPRWIDFDMGGHQLVVHLVCPSPTVNRSGGVEGDRGTARSTNPVDSHDVPVPHFGIILTIAEFDALAARLVDASIPFIIAPTVRFAGLPGEQRTMFFTDPAGNAIEFKAFADDAMIFSTQPSA